MNRRPVGVILSAIVLGLGSLLLLVMALLTLAGFLLGSHAPANPGVPQPPPGFLLAMGVVMSLAYIALAGWAIATLVGLVRMKNWARISIMIIGGFVAALGLFTALVSLAMPTLMASVPMPQPSPDPRVMRGVFFVMAFVFLLVAAIGVWWLVYFAMRNTRAAFQSQTQPIYFDSDIAAGPQAYNGHTLAPAQTTQSKPQANGNIRPVSITILSVIFLLGGTMIVATLFLHQPFMFFGFVLHGKAVMAIKLAFAIWTVAAGIGMMKLEKPSWYLAMAYCGFGILNTVSMLLPGGALRMQSYMREVVASGPIPNAPSFDPFAGAVYPMVIIPGVIFGIAIVVFAMVLLWRARWAFEPAATHADDQAAV